jgi:hypothetical protein
MASRPGELAGRLTIFADGVLAPPVTLVGGASLNGGIFLLVAVVGKALKGSMVGERMN